MDGTAAPDPPSPRGTAQLCLGRKQREPGGRKRAANEIVLSPGQRPSRKQLLLGAECVTTAPALTACSARDAEQKAARALREPSALGQSTKNGTGCGDHPWRWRHLCGDHDGSCLKLLLHLIPEPAGRDFCPRVSECCTGYLSQQPRRWRVWLGPFQNAGGLCVRGAAAPCSQWSKRWRA